MTVSNTTTKVSHNGNDATTVFAYTFPIYATSDLEVVLRDADGVNTVLTLTTDYTVSGAGNPSGGNVTMGTAPATGETLIIRRKLPLTQALDLVANAGLDADSLEERLDRAVMILQQHDEEIGRAVKVTLGDTTDPDDLVADLEADAAAASASASAAAASASAAAASETAAADSETNAASSEIAAAASAAAAGSSETNAAASETAAAASEANASASENAAAASEDNAATSETNAAASEATASAAASSASTSATSAAASAAKLTGTSASSVAVGTGSKAFTTQASKFFDAGNWLLITSDADPTNFMHGQVTAYSGTALTVDVADTGGSGTHTDWTIRVSGTRGAAGASGAPDVDGQTQDSNPDVADELLTYDISAAAIKKAVLSDLFKALHALTADTAPDVADEVMTYDASASAAKRVALSNLFKVIDALTADTAPDIADEVATYDASASGPKKARLDNVFKIINALTEDTSPDSANDFVVTYDASASGPKKVKLSNISTSLVGVKAESYQKVSLGTTGGSVAIDTSAGSIQYITLNANTTFTFTNWPASGYFRSIILDITQPNPAKTITWSATTVQYPGTSAPALGTASKRYRVSISSDDGGTTIVVVGIAAELG